MNIHFITAIDNAVRDNRAGVINSKVYSRLYGARISAKLIKLYRGVPKMTLSDMFNSIKDTSVKTGAMKTFNWDIMGAGFRKDLDAAIMKEAGDSEIWDNFAKANSKAPHCYIINTKK